MTTNVTFGRKLVDSHPEVPLLRVRLTQAYRVLASVERQLHRVPEALTALDSSTRISRELLALQPSSTEFMQEVFEDCLVRAELLLVNDRPTQAAEALGEAAKLPVAQGSGYFQAAVLLARATGKVTAVPSVSPNATESPAELARRYNDRALDLLRRAVRQGFRDLGLLSRDPDLGALRYRQDFRLLVLDLAFPVDPFSPAR